MINNEALADRLNAFKNNEPIPESEESRNYEYKGQESLPLLVTFLTQFINIGLIFIKSLGYGFAAKTIFSTDWSFWQYIAVGFAFEVLLTTILNSFTKNN